MMRCEKARQFIHSYLDGEIRSPERRVLEEHLAACDACRRELATNRAMLGLLTEMPRRHLSDDFDRALNSRIAGLSRRRAPWALWSRLWQMNAWRLRPVLLPTAAALAALVAFEFVPSGPGPDGVAPPIQRSVYVARCLNAHEAAARWRGLPETAVDFNLQVSSAATVADDLIP